MFFPVRTDRRLQHTPWVNYGLIAANTLIFIMTQAGIQGTAYDRFLLQPTEPDVWFGLPYQFITYQFLHADWMHLLGNMLFLYVFGNSVEDRLGKVGYLSFYLAGGVLAGLGHAMLDANPVLGASGAVAAVTGAYLALFPMSNVTIIYWFIFIGAFEISSIYLILFQIAQNIFFQLRGGGGVAYAAHLAGYLYGFLVGMSLLWSRLLPREPYDMLSMIEQRRRRAKFTALTRGGFQPWEAGKSGASSHAGGEAPKLTAEQQRLAEMRSGVSAALADHNMPVAAGAYVKLLELDSKQVMNQQQQLDIANQLASDGQYDAAARAYELFLSTYGKYAQREQIELMLGLIYARYLSRGQRALELLRNALPRLHDDSQKQLAQRMLTEIERR